MTWDIVNNLLSTYGFPILACIAMGWYMYNMGKQNREDRKESTQRHLDQIDKMNERHDKQINKMIEAVSNNTKAIQKLEETLNK